MIISPDKRQSRRVVNYHRHPESDQRAGPSAPQRRLSCGSAAGHEGGAETRALQARAADLARHNGKAKK